MTLANDVSIGWRQLTDVVKVTLKEPYALELPKAPLHLRKLEAFLRRPKNVLRVWLTKILAENLISVAKT